MKHIPLYSLGFLLMSCGSYNYIRQDVQTPTFTQAKTFRTNVDVSLHHLESQIAYSVSSVIGVCGSFFAPFPLSEPNVYLNNNSNNYAVELGAIYFKAIAKDRFKNKKFRPYFDVNLGLGVGNCNNNNAYFASEETEETASKWNKLYAQGDLYFVNQKKNSHSSFQFGFGTKLSMCNYQFIDKVNIENKQGTTDDVNPDLFVVKRNARNFIIPVQDFYTFVSKDFALSEGFGLNLALKIGYTAAYSQVEFSNREVLKLDPNYYGSVNLYNDKHDDLQFRNKQQDDSQDLNNWGELLSLLIGFSVGIKI